jgi:hypothetical protein
MTNQDVDQSFIPQASFPDRGIRKYGIKLTIALRRQDLAVQWSLHSGDDERLHGKRQNQSRGLSKRREHFQITTLSAMSLYCVLKVIDGFCDKSMSCGWWY